MKLNTTMKALLMFIIFLSYNLSYGQTLSDTIMVVENDSILIYRGIASREVKFKGSIDTYIKQSIPDSVLSYVYKNKFKGKIYFKLLINTNGKTKFLGAVKNRDSYIENACYQMFNSMEWEPALDNEGIPVNRLIVIPLVF